MDLVTSKIEIENINDLDLISSVIQKNKSYFKYYPFILMVQRRELISEESCKQRPESVINFFNTIRDLDPLSPNIIRMLLQIKSKHLLKRIIRENIKTIIKILNYTKIEPSTMMDDLLEDGDPDIDSEYILYYRYCPSQEIMNTFIEELYPYFTPKNFSINENNRYFQGFYSTEEKDLNLLISELKGKKISLNLLLQVMNSNIENINDFPIIKQLSNMNELEIKTSGNEKLSDITVYLEHLDTTNSLKIKRKIIESISIEQDRILQINELENTLEENSEYKRYRQKAIIDSLKYLETLIYIGEQYRDKIPFEENKLYQLCLKLIYINKKETVLPYVEEVFKNIFIKISKEETFYKRKKLWLEYFSNFIKLDTIEELIIFNKLGLIIKEANNYTTTEIENIKEEDYFEILNQISKVSLNEKKEAYINIYHLNLSIQEISLKALLTLGKNNTLHLIKKFDRSKLSNILTEIDTQFISRQIELMKKKLNTEKMNKEEIKELEDHLRIQIINSSLIPFLEKLIILSNKYQNKIQYKNTIEYEELYEEYKSYIKRKCSITDDKHDEKIRFIFNKMIRTEDFIKYFINISSIKSIIMLYKTENYIIDQDKFSIEEIEEFNSKQYNDIRNRILGLIYQRENNIIEINTLALKMLCFLGYDISKLLLQQKEIEYSKLSIFISSFENKKKKEIIEGFKSCLREHPNIFELSNEQLECYYDWYEYLSRNLKRKVKHIDIISYENISNEKLLFEANYFPIIKNIHLIENKDHKRNILKTGTLWLEQKERMFSTIPEYQNDLENYHYEMIDMHNPDLIFLPNIVGCCMIIGSLAEADLIYAVTNENGRLFGVYKDGEIIAISWVWRNNQVVCFDNIEVKRDMISEELSHILLKIIEDTANSIIKISKENESEKESIKLVTLGRNPHDVKLELKEENLLKNYQKEMFHPKNEEGLYLVDSANKQYIIAGDYQEELDHEIKVKYRYPRKPAVRFEDINKLTLDNMINSIKRNNHIDSPTPVYRIGYLGEDYYIGITTKNDIDIVYSKTDPRSKEDVISLLEPLKEENAILTERIKQEDNLIESIMNKPYDIDEENLEELIDLINSSESYKEDEYYYHGSSNKNILKILLNKKIVCPYRLGFRTNNHNGTYHLCVTKNLNINSGAFNQYVKNETSIILKKDLPILDKSKTNSNFLNPFPQESGKRTYGYKDEFHVVEQITDEYFEAVYLKTTEKKDLIFIRKIVELLDYIHYNLPIISHTNQKVIDPQLIKRYIK